MAQQNALPEQDEYRMALVRSGSNAIWTKRDAGVPHLPKVFIPRWARRAQQLQQAVEADWHLRAIVLDILPGKGGLAPCAVVQVLSSESNDELSPTNINDISEEEMAGEQRAVVRDVVSGGMGAHGPFSRVGWIEDAIEWLRNAVGHKAAFTGKARQYSATGSSALVRFATQSGPAYWLKAAGEPNAAEFRITKMLSESCAEFLPSRIAEREDWNAWLMEDAGTSPDSLTLSRLELALCSMAALQQKTIEQTGAFLSAGASDQRICVLRAHVGGVVEYLRDAMAIQTSIKVPRLETGRLREIEKVLEDACLRMEALEIPDTVVHNDMNLGNLLFDGSRCVFTDWCEGGVGSPFVGFQYLCLLKPPDDKNWMPRLREVYKQCWCDRLNSSQIDQAFRLTPLLAILSYLYGRGTWLDSARRYDPHFASYARSLARRMDRAAQDSRLLEVLCH